MRVCIKPSRARGSVKAPPSKSDAHRLLIGAGLCRGESQVAGVAFSQDVQATLDCLTALGAKVRAEGDTLTVIGADPFSFDGKKPLYCRESGSTLRFMIPLCLLGKENCTLLGSEKLLSRPQSVYEAMAKEKGLRFEQTPGGISVRGPLLPGDYRLAGDVSSQFFSGLLFALPLLAKDSTLAWTTPLTSRPYIDMTLDTLAKFGVTVEPKENCLAIPGGQRYTPGRFFVEGDYSNAAFLAAFNLAGGEVTLTGLSENSRQGDRVFSLLFEIMQQGFCAADLGQCPDLGPILFAMAALCHGGRFTGTERLRLKESDRVAAMAEELAKCGVTLDVAHDCVTVPQGQLHAPRAPLCGHNDHRIVMALSVLLSVTGGEIEGAEAVAKSFPDFFDVIQNLGIEVSSHAMDL